MTRAGLDVWIPDGYSEMPLTDIARRMSAVEAIFNSLPPSEAKTVAQAVLPAATALFVEMTQLDARYCGIGQHTSPEGGLVTSCLTVCVTDGENINPRLVLTHLVESRAESGLIGVTDVREVDGRPMLFSERVRELPAPEVPGVPYTGDTATTYQLEAVVPSEDGASIAAIELSTPYVDHGPQFRKMIVDMARSVVFRPAEQPDYRPSSLNL